MKSVSYSRSLYRHNDSGGWVIGLRDASGRIVENCSTAPDCELGTSGRDAAATFADLSTSAIRFGVWCAPTPPFAGCDNGATLHRAQAILYGATVTIDDPVAPSEALLSGVPSAWTDSGFTVTVGGRDNVSVSSRTVQISGQELGRLDASCDYTYTVPCPASGEGAVPVSLGSLPDGEHEVKAVVYDPGGLFAASAPQTIRIDRHAPLAPGLARAGGLYAPGDLRGVVIDLRGDQAAPVTTAITQVCASGTEDCSPPSEQAVSAPDPRVDVQLPRDGLFEVRAWLRDAAGNADPSSRAGIELGRDSVPPEVTLRTSHVGDVAEGTVVTARYAQQDPAPSAGQGASGFELSTDGAPYAESDGSFTVKAGHRYRVRAYVSDRAGNRTTTPSAAIDGVPDSAPSGAAPPASFTRPAAQAAPSNGNSVLTRRAAKLALSYRRLTGGRLRITLAAPPDATGVAAMDVRLRRGTRTLIRRRARITLGGGRARWTVRLPRGTTHASSTARYSGDRRYLPADHGTRLVRLVAGRRR